MAQVSTRLPEELIRGIDDAARRLHRTRAEVIRQAIEYYLEDVVDLQTALQRLQDPADPVLDWDEVRRELLAAD